MKELAITLMIIGVLLLLSPLWLIATHYTPGNDGGLFVVQLFASLELFAGLAAWLCSVKMEERASPPR